MVSNNKHSDDNLLGVIETLFRWKKEILYTCVAAAVLSIITSLVLPEYYKATTTFYAASTDLAAPERIFGEISSDAMEYYGESADVDRVITISKSNELVDFMIDSFKLYDRYKIKQENNIKAPYYVRLKFFDLYNIKQTKYDAIQLSVEDKDPAIAAKMANDARQKTSEVLSRLIKDSQGEVLNTYKKSIFDGEKYLNILNDSLRNTRDRYQVYNTVTQSEGISRNLSNARSKLLINTIELEEMKKSGQVPRDTIRRRGAVIAAATQQITALEAQLNMFNKGMAKVEFLETLQEEAAEQLSVDQERFKKYTAAYNSFFPTIHVVEEAKIPIIKSRPIRWLIVVGSTLIAFILSILAVLLLDYYKDVDWKKIVNAK